MVLELEKRNLINVIENCLMEHKVFISQGKSKIPFYLTMVQMTNHGLFEDFKKVYSGVEDFQIQMAKKLMKKNNNQTYGVLIDSDLKYQFAFNRKFADFDRQKNKIVFKSPEEVLLTLAKGDDLAPSIETGESLGVPSLEDNIVFRYAIQKGKRKRKDNIILDYSSKIEGLFERPSLLDIVKKSYIALKIPLNFGRGKKEDFFLLSTSYRTSTLDDFKETYGQDIEEFKCEVAARIFPKGKTENSYGVFLTKDLQMKFAFNQAFAKYDPKLKEVIYNSPEEILLSGVWDSDNVVETPNIPTIKYGLISRRPRGPRISGRQMLIKYAITGKRV